MQVLRQASVGIWIQRLERELVEDCAVAHMQGAKPWNADWKTWQAWQVPLKKWMEDAYL